MRELAAYWLDRAGRRLTLRLWPPAAAGDAPASTFLLHDASPACTLPVYEVECDPDTGIWLGEPAPTGARADEPDWRGCEPGPDGFRTVYEHRDDVGVAPPGASRALAAGPEVLAPSGVDELAGGVGFHDPGCDARPSSRPQSTSPPSPARITSSAA